MDELMYLKAMFGQKGMTVADNYQMLLVADARARFTQKTNRKQYTGYELNIARIAFLIYEYEGVENLASKNMGSVSKSFIPFDEAVKQFLPLSLARVGGITCESFYP